MDLFQIGADFDPCTESGILPFVKIIKHGLIPVIQIGIPIILIVLGMIDLGKAVIASDDGEVKKAQGRLIRRCIYAVAVFFVVTLVTLLFNLVAESSSKSGTNAWADCWNNKA